MHIRQTILSVLLLIASLAVGSNSAYISRVYDYRPAPGQFISQAYPSYSEGESYDVVLARVDSLLSGAPDGSRLVCLGAWGGYVTFGFDHPVVNVPGAYDLMVHGNAFFATGSTSQASAEPGVVFVSVDVNGDGLSNDPWYEIAGSEYASSLHGYEVTYYRDNGDVPWEDNQGHTDFICRNPFHTQSSYYPLWLTEDQYTLSGTLLPSNLDTTTMQAHVYTDGYGYVDMWPNGDDRTKINLDWAVTADGQPAHLSHIDFVRVQTGIMAPKWGPNGISGEMSTELSGAEDLHPDEPLGLENMQLKIQNSKFIIQGQLLIRRDDHLYNTAGQRVR